MPELPPDVGKRGFKWRLSNAHDAGQLIKINCAVCCIRRLYRPGDLLLLCGDVTIREVANKFRCEKCGERDYMSSDQVSIYGPDIGQLRVRRLVQIKTIRKPIWRDEII